MNRSGMLRRWVAVAGCVLCLTATGCSAATTDATEDAMNETVSQSEADRILDKLGAEPAKKCDSGKGLTLGFAAVWSSNAGGKASNDAFAAAAEHCGATALVVEAKRNDPLNTMISALDLITSKKADVAAFYPLTPDVMTEPSRRAVAAGIPVVAGEATNWDGAVTTFHQDRLTGAVNAAELFCAKYPDGGEVIYGAYGQPQADLIAYQKRFAKELSACSGGALRVVGEYANKTDDIAGGIGPAQALMQQHPDVIGVVTYSDTNAVAASRAATNLGIRDKLTIVGYNADAVGLDALKKGVIDYSFVWGQPELAQQMVDVMIAVANGEDVPKFITSYPKCVSRATAKEIPSVAVRTAGIAAGRDLGPTGLQPAIESEKPLAEVADDLRAGAACPVD